MNRRDVFKGLFGASVAAVVVHKSSLFTRREQVQKVNRAPRDTDDWRYDIGLDDYNLEHDSYLGKDEMHL